MNSVFWKNKRVFITGHTGFKGSWLSLWLQSLGAHIIGFALPPSTDPNLFQLMSLEKNIHSHMGDIRNFNDLNSIIEKEKPEIVFHLAAQSLVRRSYLNPIETYSTNVMGTVNLLESLRRVESVKAAVIVTSDKCYDNRERLQGYMETDAMGGYDPYSSSKGCAELVTSAYRSSFFTQQEQEPLHVASARAGNVIGGGDWSEDRLIPDFLRAIRLNRPLKVRNPHAIRPWQHVLEPLGGYLLLAEHLWNEKERFSSAWNFGPVEQDTKSVEWVANYLTKCWGDSAKWELYNQEAAPHEAQHLKLDISKAQTELKWNPRWSLEKALDMTVDWYKTYQANLDVREVMLKQIDGYQAFDR